MKRTENSMLLHVELQFCSFIFTYSLRILYTIDLLFVKGSSFRDLPGVKILPDGTHEIERENRQTCKSGKPLVTWTP